VTYDGRFKYPYDAWNRKVKSSHAYRAPSTTAVAGKSEGDLIEGSVVNEIAYDGLNRRVVKQVTNSADLDCTYHYYFDGQSIIEERDGSDNVLRQNVWGLMYIDELVQTALNEDPDSGSEQDVEEFFYLLHDVQFNILGMVDDGGEMVERYEYTPYGQRSVFGPTGRNDALCGAYLLIGERQRIGSTLQPYALNPFGHQGLYHDEETGNINNRARILNPRLGRFMQTEPFGYIDGMSLYQYVASNPVKWVDPTGKYLEPVSLYMPGNPGGPDIPPDWPGGKDEGFAPIDVPECCLCNARLDPIDMFKPNKKCKKDGDVLVLVARSGQPCEPNKAWQAKEICGDVVCPQGECT